MNKFTKTANTINAVHGLSEIERQVQFVKNSNLTEEEKNKALKSHNKMIKTTILIVIILTIIMLIIYIAAESFMSSETKVIVMEISAFGWVIILITYAIIAKTKKMFPDWMNAYDKVNNGFDGLEEQEINKLKPTDKEKLIIKKYKKKSVVSALIFLLSLVIEFSIILSLEIAIYSFITIIITLIITGVWYIFEDTYQVEIHKIESGYYKKSFEFICPKCKVELKIKFEDLEKYNFLPKNEQGKRVMNCHNCGNPVPLYDFDNVLEDYKKYIEQVK